MAGLRSQQIKDVMTHDVVTLAPTSKVTQAAEAMKSLNVGAIPICDGGRLLGMVTDRDLVVRVIAEHRNPETETINNIMTTDVDYCYEDQTVEEAAHVMEDRQVRRMPIVNHDKELVGIVSLGDVAVKGVDKSTTADALEQISQPIPPQREGM
jgi:CBS domain-containing protein